MPRRPRKSRPPPRRRTRSPARAADRSAARCCRPRPPRPRRRRLSAVQRDRHGQLHQPARGRQELRQPPAQLLAGQARQRDPGQEAAERKLASHAKGRSGDGRPFRVRRQAQERERALPTLRSASIARPLTATPRRRPVSAATQVPAPIQPSRSSRSSATAAGAGAVGRIEQHQVERRSRAAPSAITEPRADIAVRLRARARRCWRATRASAAGSCSTNRHDAAPRDSASSPSAPEPANRSRDRAAPRSCRAGWRASRTASRGCGRRSGRVRLALGRGELAAAPFAGDDPHAQPS